MKYQICTKGVWDSTIPGITFDDDGVSNYAKIFYKLVERYPRGKKGLEEWESIISGIKNNSKKQKYNCVIGVSGGTDSSYLLHIAKKEYGLRPLAVNLDNGWNSEVAVQNIKKVTSDLGIDLVTYVIDYEEIKNILRSYIRASLPWIDLPTDIAIKAVLYEVASRENVKYIFRGNDFRSEGTQPKEWTYGDSKQLNYIHNTFGNGKRKTFPDQTLFHFLFYSVLKRIKSVFPYYYLDYQKNTAQKYLKENYNWEYYGGHHHENIFTKFAISYWLPEKFNIDKRKITLSAQVLSGEITRNEAINELKKPPYDSEKISAEKQYLFKKLNISESEFSEILKSENKYFYDYPSYYPLIQKYLKIITPVLVKILGYKPMAIFQAETRADN